LKYISFPFGIPRLSGNYWSALDLFEIEQVGGATDTIG
jgi:hypothetical protein